jgi:preprotein translocase subunit SecF
MFIVTYRKFFFIFSGLLMVASLVALLVWGLKPSIDFKGGSLIEVEYASGRPAVEKLKAALDPLKLGEYSVRETGERGYIIRTENLGDAGHTTLLAALAGDKGVVPEEKRFNAIGPLLGREAANKAYLSIALVIIAIVLFITFAFRKVSEPVSSWKYGFVAIFALLHDVLVPVGVFAALGHFTGMEVDTLFVTALLVILGFSVHDTIVVFDRIRENLKVSGGGRERKSFETIVGESINQTFVRSINTSLTTLLALVVLFVFGPETTKNFSLALLVGITAGTYSSICIASPLLIVLARSGKK